MTLNPIIPSDPMRNGDAYRKDMPSGDFLRAHLRYDAETGLLYRRSTGQLATLEGYQYSRVSLKHVYYQAHRVIWRMEVSEDVPHEIDHIDGDRRNNRLANLRPASSAENKQNSLKPKNNTSGFKGVHWCKSSQKWKAAIKINYQSIYLGLFDDPALAHQAYVDAAVRYHGEYANDGTGPIRMAPRAAITHEVTL